MYRMIWLASVTLLLAMGCNSQETKNAKNSAETQDSKTPAKTTTSESGDSITLNGENTKVEFVGTHLGEKPDPRLGGFQELSGKIAMDAGAVSAITVDMQTESLYTEIEKLTNHLKSPDFFDVKQFPQISFTSTKITPGSDGEVNVTGDLTLLGVTKEISFPATVSMDGDELQLTSKFEIDRTQFGMNYGSDKVDKIVVMSVTVGEK